MYDSIVPQYFVTIIESEYRHLTLCDRLYNILPNTSWTLRIMTVFKCSTILSMD